MTSLIRPLTRRALPSVRTLSRALPRYSANDPADFANQVPSSTDDATVSANYSLNDAPITLQEGDPTKIDWTKSFHGLSTEPFSAEAAGILTAPIDVEDIEIKSDGILYLPEIKYRRILNKAFSPGGWGLAPRGETSVSAKQISREYALVCNGRLVSVARGEQDFYDHNGIATATEGCKSNALMRCCKDLGIASELWDPRFIRKFKKEYCTEQFVEHVVTKKKKKLWRRKENQFEYPYKVVSF